MRCCCGGRRHARHAHTHTHTLPQLIGQHDSDAASCAHTYTGKHTHTHVITHISPISRALLLALLLCTRRLWDCCCRCRWGLYAWEAIRFLMHLRIAALDNLNCFMSLQPWLGRLFPGWLLSSSVIAWHWHAIRSVSCRTCFPYMFALLQAATTSKAGRRRTGEAL